MVDSGEDRDPERLKTLMAKCLSLKAAEVGLSASEVPALKSVK